MLNPRGSPKHLSVALDDSNGYALHKLDVSDLAGDDSDMESDVATCGTEEPQPLPQPVLRLSFCSFGDARVQCPRQQNRCHHRFEMPRQRKQQMSDPCL